MGAISKCRVEAMAFDGINQLFWPIYEMSPGVKVIVLNWRTHQEIKASSSSFGRGLYWSLFLLNLLVISIHILPWNAFVLPILDPLFGSPIDDHMRNGKPFHEGLFNSMGHEPFVLCIWRLQLTERRQCQHWSSGFGI